MPLKSIENAARALLLRTAVGALGGGAPPPLPDWRAGKHRVLFIRDDGIGDFIVSIEVMRAIAEVAPGMTLDVLASPQNAPVARLLPFVNEVLVHKRGSLVRSWPLWRALRRNRYDAVVDGRVAVRNVNVQTTAVLLATGAPWRIGLAGRGNDAVYTVPIPELPCPHWTDQLVALAAPFGIASGDRDWRPHLPLDEAARAVADRAWRRVGIAARPRVVVNLSVGHPERRWPAERYAPVLARLRERLPAAAIMLVAMPGELDAAERLAKPVAGLAVPLTLLEVIAVVASADLLISPDTSVTHVASAFSIPTICLQRKGTGQWSPYRTPGRVVFSDDPKRVEPLPTARVVAAVDSVIDELAGARGWVVR